MNTLKANEVKLLGEIEADFKAAQSEGRLRDVSHHINELLACEMHTDEPAIRNRCAVLLDGTAMLLVARAL